MGIASPCPAERTAVVKSENSIGNDRVTQPSKQAVNVDSLHWNCMKSGVGRDAILQSLQSHWDLVQATNVQITKICLLPALISLLPHSSSWILIAVVTSNF